MKILVSCCIGTPCRRTISIRSSIPNCLSVVCWIIWPIENYSWVVHDFQPTVYVHHMIWGIWWWYRQEVMSPISFLDLGFPVSVQYTSCLLCTIPKVCAFFSSLQWRIFFQPLRAILCQKLRHDSVMRPWVFNWYSMDIYIYFEQF